MANKSYITLKNLRGRTAREVDTLDHVTNLSMTNLSQHELPLVAFLEDPPQMATGRFALGSPYGSFTLAETHSGMDSDSDSCPNRNRGRDPSLSMCNVNMFSIVPCNHQVWNLNPSLYPSSSPSV